MSKWITAIAAVALLAGAGCKKKHYSSNCSRSLSLVAPWDTMKLPLGDNSRVCSVNDLKADIEHLDGDRAAWEHSYDTAMVAQGFTKERCSSTSCSYLRPTGEKMSVQINQVANGKKAKTIVHLTRTPPKTQ
jgi:hypothetical protein